MVYCFKMMIFVSILFFVSSFIYEKNACFLCMKKLPFKSANIIKMRMIADDYDCKSSKEIFAQNRFEAPPLPQSYWAFPFEINNTYILSMMFAQGLLLVAAYGLGSLSGIDVVSINNISYDNESIQIAAGLGSLIWLIGALLDRMNYPGFRDVRKRK